MPRLWLRAYVPALVALLWIGAALAATFPPLSGRVVDAAHILSPVTIADLERKLADLEQKSGIQLVVATVPSLEGEEIEPYANELFRAWKLGESKKDNGGLLLVAPKEKKIRIEVGYGLEGTLTDAISSLIIRNAIAPRFKAGRLQRRREPRGRRHHHHADDRRGRVEAEAHGHARGARGDAPRHAGAVPVLSLHHVRSVAGGAARRRQRGRHSDGHGRRLWGRVRRGRRIWRRGRLLRRRRLLGRRRRVGGLVMFIDPAEAARIEKAFDDAQTKTRAPLMCVLASASISRDAEFLLAACLLALVTPLPLLLFTEMSAQRIYVAQLLVAILAAVLGSVPWVRRMLVPKRASQAAGHRAALAQFVVRGLDRSQCGVLVYVSLAEHYIRIIPAEDAARAVPQEEWQAVVDEALKPLAAGATEAALTNLAARCADLLARPFPPGAPWQPPDRIRFHIV